MWTCWHGSEGRKKGWAWSLPPLFSLLVFSIFLSRLRLHARCHILIAHSSKLISDNARLMETFPKHTLPPSYSLHPLPVCLFLLSNTISQKKDSSLKGYQNMLMRLISDSLCPFLTLQVRIDETLSLHGVTATFKYSRCGVKKGSAGKPHLT